MVAVYGRLNKLLCVRCLQTGRSMDIKEFALTSSLRGFELGLRGLN